MTAETFGMLEELANWCRTVKDESGVQTYMKLCFMSASIIDSSRIETPSIQKVHRENSIGLASAFHEKNSHMHITVSWAPMQHIPNIEHWPFIFMVGHLGPAGPVAQTLHQKCKNLATVNLGECEDFLAYIVTRM